MKPKVGQMVPLNGEFYAVTYVSDTYATVVSPGGEYFRLPLPDVEPDAMAPSDAYMHGAGWASLLRVLSLPWHIARVLWRRVRR